MTKLFFALTLFLTLNSFAEALTTVNPNDEIRPGGASTIAAGIECEACRAMEKANALLSNADGVFYPNGGGTATPGVVPDAPVGIGK